MLELLLYPLSGSAFSLNLADTYRYGTGTGYGPSFLGANSMLVNSDPDMNPGNC
jgi:hypothetical protein